MKKVIVYIGLFIGLFFCIGIFCYIRYINSSNHQTKKYIQSLKSKINYYIPTYQQRYIDYKQKHWNLSDEDVVTYVNLNLDKNFYTNTFPSPYQNTKYILINKFYYVDKKYVPNHLKIIKNCTKGNIYLVEEALTHFEQMCKDIKKENLNIRAISAYRDYNYQLNLYNRYLVNDTKENVDTYSARPGYSEHQSGLTVDIDNLVTDFNDFESTDEFLWMQKNAYKYGFILRYPKDKENITGYMYESWHYRYVGKKVATYIKKHNITFDEYYARFLNTMVNYS